MNTHAAASDMPLKHPAPAQTQAMNWRHMLLAMLVAASWGANFASAKIAMQELPPFLLLWLRFTIVAVVVLPFCPRPAISWRALTMLSLLLGTLHFAFMFLSIGLGLSASGAVIASQLGVPFSCLLGSIMFNDKLGRWRSFGMLVSFSGVVIIAGEPEISRHFIPFLVACTGALAWASANMAMKRMGSVPILPLLAWISLLCVPQLGLMTLIFEQGQLQAIRDASLLTWGAVLYTTFISLILAYGIWYRLLQRFPMSQVAPYSLLVPVFGLSACHFILGEPLSAQFLTGGVLTIVGVGVIVLRRPRLGLLAKT